MSTKPLQRAAQQARLGELCVVVFAVMAANLWPIYRFASEINEDEYSKTRWMVMSSICAAATFAITRVYRIWRGIKEGE